VVPYPENLAEKQCVFAWKHHSLNHIAAVLLFNVIPALAYYLVVYTYYKQTVDSTHNACLLGGRSTSGATTAGRYRRAERGGYSRIETRERDHHNLANETSMTTARLEYALAAGGALTPRQRRAAQQAPYTKRPTTIDVNAASGSSSRPVATSGPQAKRTFVSRGIHRNHRPPPLISSPSPLGLDSTPGAPSYNRGPSRVYAAFAAPVSSSEYDKFI